MLAEAGPHDVVSLVTIRTRPQADVIYTSSPKYSISPLIKKRDALPAPIQPEKNKSGIICPCKTPCLSQLPLPFSLDIHLPSSLVLRLSTLRILRLLLWTLIPPLRSSLHRDRLPSSSLHHVLDIRSVAQILVELTDVAPDVLVRLEAEGNDWEKVLVSCDSVVCSAQMHRAYVPGMKQNVNHAQRL